MSHNQTPKLDHEAIRAKIAEVHTTHVPGTTCTICVLVLHSGFTIVESVSALSPETFNPELGAKIAFDKALGKLTDYCVFAALDAQNDLRNKLTGQNQAGLLLVN